MKTSYIKFALLAVFASLAMAGCQKTDLQQTTSGDENVNGDFLVTFNCSMAETDPMTKTEFHDNTIWWSAGDCIAFGHYYYETAESTTRKSVTYTRNVESASETYSATIGFPTPGKFPVHYYSFYPYAARINSITGDNYKATLRLEPTQHPTAVSFDPNVDLLISQYVVSDAKQTKMNLKYKRMVAIGKMNVKNLPVSDEIGIIRFVPEKDGGDVILSGNGRYDFSTGEKYADATTAAYVNMDYSDKSVSAEGEGMTAYFCCYPFTLMPGDSFTTTLNTKSGYNFVKKSVVPESFADGFKFEYGKGTQFNVDMSKANLTETPYLKISKVSFTNGTVGAKFTGKASAGITALKYMFVSKAAFDAISDLEQYVSENEGSMTALKSEDISSLNAGGNKNTGGLLSLGESVVIAKVARESETDIMSFSVQSDWIYISASTSSTKGGKIAIRFVGTGISKVQYAFVKSTEAPATINAAYFDTLGDAIKSLASSYVTAINEAGTAGKSYGIAAGEVSTKYLVMVKATSTDGKTSFMYQKDVTSSAAE